MKTFPVVFCFFVAGILLATAGCTSVSSPGAVHPARPVRLQVAIVVPASMNTIRDDDVAETFGESVRAALHQHGFRGRIHLLDETEAEAPGVPTLEINLTEWRVDPVGSVACTFGASLHTPGGGKDLGLFTGTSLMAWARRDWVARSDSFRDAAHDALDNLADRLEQTGLITKVPAG